MNKAPDDLVEHEVVLSESVSENDRRLRVYMPGGEDFVIDIPGGSKVTFGYFNPTVAGDRQVGREAWGSAGAGGTNVIKTTALRIYEKGEKSNQLACFLGAIGFRDLAIKKTALRQRVVIERNFTDDGEGEVVYGGHEKRALIAASEDDGVEF